MDVRFLLHNAFSSAGGVLTVTLGLAQALSVHHDVELVSLFSRTEERAVHRLPPDVPVRVLHRPERSAEWTPEERRLAAEPSRYVPEGEPRRDAYSALIDRRVAEFLGSVGSGVVVTMQPGLNVLLARLGTDRFLKVAQDHRPFIDRPRPLREAYVAAAPGLDAFLTLTATDERRYAALLGPGIVVRRMPNGAPAPSGPTAALESKVVVAAGRLRRSKGFDLLVEAWAEVARRHPDWRLRIYGKGPERPQLERQVRELGLTDVVQLPGYTTELPARMAEGSLFVLSSRSEGYGMVLVEAMSAGVPVVSTDCPFGPAEIVDHGTDGLLVPNRDVAALADAISRMIEMTPSERRVWGAAARRSSAARSFDAVARRWEELFVELAGARRPQAG